MDASILIPIILFIFLSYICLPQLRLCLMICNKNSFSFEYRRKYHNFVCLVYLTELVIYRSIFNLYIIFCGF